VESSVINSAGTVLSVLVDWAQLTIAIAINKIENIFFIKRGFEPQVEMTKPFQKGELVSDED